MVNDLNHQDNWLNSARYRMLLLTLENWPDSLFAPQECLLLEKTVLDEEDLHDLTCFIKQHFKQGRPFDMNMATRLGLNAVLQPISQVFSEIHGFFDKSFAEKARDVEALKAHGVLVDCRQRQKTSGNIAPKLTCLFLLCGFGIMRGL